MLQLLEFPSVAGKRWEWHLVLFKEWLRQVEAGISDRKYIKWLRTRKVFDRRFMGFVEAFLGIEHPARSAPTLGDVALELLDELGNAEERASQQQARLLESGPGRDAPRSRGPALPPVPGRKQAQAVEAAPEEEAYKPPSAEDDPFLRALLERFNELNSYLSMFVYKEIKDDFLAPTELYRRIGTNDYRGLRPSMPQFQAWIVWVEWLGGLKKVGFRHKFTQAGKDVGAYLIEMPLEELLEPDAEVADATPTDEPKREATLVTPAKSEASEEQPGLGDEDFDEDEFEEEGLDLPPSADVEDAIPYWKKDELPATPQGPPAAIDATAPERREAAPVAEVPQAVVTADRDPVLERDGEDAKDEAQARAEAALPQAVGAGYTPAQPSAACAGAGEGHPRPDGREQSSEAKPSEAEPGDTSGRSRRFTASPEGARREALRQATRWWLDRPHRERPLTESGVSVRPHPSGKPVGLFKLLALATLLEGDGSPAEARALFQELDDEAVFEALLVEDAPLERALEVAWRSKAPGYLEERLVHLLRYRQGLRELDSSALWEGDAHHAARVLQRIVTGDTLGPGLIFVLRELTAGGAGPAEGLEGICWLPSLLEG